MKNIDFLNWWFSTLFLSTDFPFFSKCFLYYLVRFSSSFFSKVWFLDLFYVFLLNGFGLCYIGLMMNLYDIVSSAILALLRVSGGMGRKNF